MSDSIIECVWDSHVRFMGRTFNNTTKAQQTCMPDRSRIDFKPLCGVLNGYGCNWVGATKDRVQWRYEIYRDVI